MSIPDLVHMVITFLPTGANYLESHRGGPTRTTPRVDPIWFMTGDSLFGMAKIAEWIENM